MKRLLCLLPLLMLPATAWAAPTARETIEDFYQAYLTNDPADRMKRRPPFSQAFLKDEAENRRLCAAHAGEDLCGWDAEGDPFLNAQDYADNLTFDNAGVVVSEPKAGTVEVELRLFPAGQGDQAIRHLTYAMLKEADGWVIDDIVYDNGIQGRTARNAMREEIANYKDQPKP